MRFATLLLICLTTFNALAANRTRQALEASCAKMVVKAFNDKQEASPSGFTEIPADFIKSLTLSDLKIVLNQNRREMQEAAMATPLEIGVYIADLHFDAGALKTWYEAHRSENRQAFDEFVFEHAQSMNHLNIIFADMLKYRQKTLDLKSLSELIRILELYNEMLPLDSAIALSELMLERHEFNFGMSPHETAAIRDTLVDMRLRMVRERPHDRELGLALVKEFDQLIAQGMDKYHIQLHILMRIDAAVGAIDEGKLSREEILLMKDFAARIQPELRPFNPRAVAELNRNAGFLRTHKVQIQATDPGLYLILEHAAGMPAADKPAFLN